jgi:hypothetical protein
VAFYSRKLNPACVWKRYDLSYSTQSIKQRKLRLSNINNKRENSKREQHVYHVGEKVLLNRGRETKYESPYIG